MSLFSIFFVVLQMNYGVNKMYEVFIPSQDERQMQDVAKERGGDGCAIRERQTPRS